MLCSLEQVDKRVDKTKDNFTIGFTIMKVFVWSRKDNCVIIFLSISLNICFGYSKEPSQ